MEEPSGPLYRVWDFDPSTGRDCGFKYSHRERLPGRLFEEVRPLSEAYAATLWHWVLASPHDGLHRLEKTCWAAKLRRGKRLQWRDELACRSFPWPEDDAVFHLGAAGYGYETSWGLYRRYWERFQVSTWEEGILFHPSRREAAVFWEGGVWVGRRTDRRLIRRPTDSAAAYTPAG